jgi:VanZ family protein
MTSKRRAVVHAMSAVVYLAPDPSSSQLSGFPMSEAPAKNRSFARSFAIVLALAWSALILVLCLTPGRMIPSSATHPMDKIAHTLMFAVLGLLWMTACSSARRGRWASLAVWVGGTAFGVGIEWLQGWMENGRSASTLDAVADTIGLIAGILGYHAGAGLVKWTEAVRRTP